MGHGLECYKWLRVIATSTPPLVDFWPTGAEWQASDREWGWREAQASRAMRTLPPQLKMAAGLAVIGSPSIWQMWVAEVPQSGNGPLPACAQDSLRATARDPSRPTSPTKPSQMHAELNLKQEVWLWKCGSQTILLAPLPFHETVTVPTAPKASFTLKKHGSNLCTRHLRIFHRIFRYLLHFVFWRSCMSLNLEVY